MLDVKAKITPRKNLVLGEVLPDEITDPLTKFVTKIDRKDYKIIKVKSCSSTVENEPFEGKTYIVPKHAGFDLNENEDLKEILVSTDDLIAEIEFQSKK